jgi:hypothetical protein
MELVLLEPLTLAAAVAVVTMVQALVLLVVQEL